MVRKQVRTYARTMVRTMIRTMIRIRGRKGFMSEAIVFFFSFLTFIIFTMIFYLIFSAKGCTGKTFEEKIGAQPSILAETNYMMTGFLQQPVSYDVNNDNNNETITMADMIAWCKEHNDFSAMKGRLQAIFGINGEYWELSIYDSDGNGIFRDVTSDNIGMGLDVITEKAIIPDYKNATSPIILKLTMSPGVEISSGDMTA